MEYRQPICQAFTQDILFAGGAKEPVGLNALAAVIAIFATGKLWFPLLFIFSHKYIVNLTKNDPKFFTAFVRYAQYKKYYQR
ncbi:VirB3 family type IV secretion system protein [Fusobacterium ulcerans]|uniref:VirB3 family type IV secretion system protein n=1 Tax=Fusobacterium ulcerans TaxID=861 RepID=UPI002E779EF3|nr:VirB3 family type IV secretion system protein [Fusobacterium ulcerans]MEE0137712.1 VirB3 family type IV secretion system protein [Fusobacterium ulcerans]